MSKGIEYGLNSQKREFFELPQKYKPDKKTGNPRAKQCRQPSMAYAPTGVNIKAKYTPKSERRKKMALNVKNMVDTRTAVNLAPGTYQGRLIGIAELGLQETTYKEEKKIQKQVSFLFNVYKNNNSKPVVLGKTYTMSMRENSNLRKAIMAIRGKDFTKEELKDWDLVQLLNKPCLITVGLYEKKGFKSLSITQVSMSMKDSQTPEATQEKIYFDMDNTDTWESFARMPKWLQIKINLISQIFNYHNV